MPTRTTPIATRVAGDRVVDVGIIPANGQLSLVATVTAADVAAMVRQSGLRLLLIVQTAPAANPTAFTTRVSAIFDGRREADAQDGGAAGEATMTTLADQLEAQGGAADDVAALRLHAPLQRHQAGSSVFIQFVGAVAVNDRVRAGYRVVTGNADLGLQIDFSVT